jgi:hypothetical protein
MNANRHEFFSYSRSRQSVFFADKNNIYDNSQLPLPAPAGEGWGEGLSRIEFNAGKPLSLPTLTVGSLPLPLARAEGATAMHT